MLYIHVFGCIRMVIVPLIGFIFEHAVVSSDDREHVILKALKLGAVHYIVKPVCFNDMKNLWKFVVNYSDKSRKEIYLGEEIESGGEQSSETISDEDKNADPEKKNSKRKRSTKEGNAPKKSKVVWTQELQARFLDSVHFIGLESTYARLWPFTDSFLTN